MKFIDLRVLQHHPAVFSQTVSRTISFLQSLFYSCNDHTNTYSTRAAGQTLVKRDPSSTCVCLPQTVTLLPTLLFCENRISRSVRQMKLLNKAKGKKKICSIIGTSTNNAPTLPHIYLPIKSKQNSTNFNCQIK